MQYSTVPTSESVLRLVFVSGEPGWPVPVSGVLLWTGHPTLPGLVEVGTGDSSIALRPEHLPPPLLGAGPAGGGAGTPLLPLPHLAVVH